jgi:hypothetical protein
MHVALASGRIGALYHFPQQSLVLTGLILLKDDITFEKVQWRINSQLEQNCPRVDTPRSVRRMVPHHLPHPLHGEKLSANRNILLMIPPEKEREKWVQDPSLCQLGQEALFPSHTPESSWLSGRRGWAQRREVTSKITAPLVSYRKAMYKLFGKHYLQSSLCLLMDTQMHPMLVSPLLGFPRTDSKDKGLRQSAYCRVDLVRI